VENGLDLDLTLNLTVETESLGTLYPTKLKFGLKILSQLLILMILKKSTGLNSMMLYGLKKEKLLMLSELINILIKLTWMGTKEFLTLNSKIG